MTVKTSTATIWQRDDGIIELKYDDGIIETLQTVKENFEACVKITKGEKYLVLVDSSHIGFANADARDFVAKSPNTNKVMIKAAVISNTYVGAALANLFINIDKPSFPFKVFKSREKAIEWLKK